MMKRGGTSVAASLMSNISQALLLELWEYAISCSSLYSQYT